MINKHREKQIQLLIKKKDRIVKRRKDRAIYYKKYQEVKKEIKILDKELIEIIGTL